MTDDIHFTDTVLLAGDGNLACTVAVCLLNHGHCVDLYTSNRQSSAFHIRRLLSSLQLKNGKACADKLRIFEGLEISNDYGLAIVLTPESEEMKKDIIAELENQLSPAAVIAINSESISLDILQQDAVHPERLIGLNWTEPAHTTHFLEIIKNETTPEELVNQLYNHAKLRWGKDPYIVCNTGIRSRLMSAMIREAFYLVGNGYATIEDIDRACRNDAGYYLPFAGNFRYMDLMGTVSYGMVMKDLNPELSKEQQAPDFFYDIIKGGGKGMQNGRGFYKYSDAERELWKMIIDKFSYQIQKVINKYPFGYKING